jgi:hypothetical protein
MSHEMITASVQELAGSQAMLFAESANKCALLPEELGGCKAFISMTSWTSNWKFGRVDESDAYVRN